MFYVSFIAHKYQNNIAAPNGTGEITIRDSELYLKK